MIQARAAGPGPRTAALHRAVPLLAVLALVGALVACGTSTPSGTSSISTQPPQATPGGSGGPEPTPPRWPGTTVLAVIAMGAADGEIQKAGNDLQKAADTEDLKAMWGAADGLAKMIDGLMPNIDRLTSYPLTKPVGDLYAQALPEISAGAKQLRDAITAGDAAGISAGYQQIARLVEQAIVQQRLYLN